MVHHPLWRWVCMTRTVLLCLAVAGCARYHPPAGRNDVVSAWQCAPFARAVTGVDLRGEAADWWSQAAGRYDRAQVPHVGSLLVFRPTRQMQAGHVAVVSAVLSPRRVLVAHANWAPHQVTQDQPVEDVSGAGDWTEVRVWWPASRQLGRTIYQTFGFIHPDRRIDRTIIAANADAVVRGVTAGQ